MRKYRFDNYSWPDLDSISPWRIFYRPSKQAVLPKNHVADFTDDYRFDMIAPLNQLDSLFSDVNKMFGEVFGATSKLSQADKVVETDLSCEIVVIAAGVEPSSIELSTETVDEKTSLKLKFGGTERTWFLSPRTYKIDTITCEVKHGVIKITIPKLKPALQPTAEKQVTKIKIST